MHHQPCLLLIRHAQSENNALGERLRVADPNITPLGVIQAQKMAQAVRKLAPSVLYCSPFLRSLETTRAVAQQTGLVPIVRQDIYEQGGCHSGYLPEARVAVRGMKRQELESKYVGWRMDDRIGHDGWYDLDHYETANEACERAQRVKQWFESERILHSPNDRVAMVIHADFKMRLIELFLENESAESQLGDIVNTSISRLSRVGNRWKLDYWNVFSHLEADEISF
jgi:2,3-bisphosphoglycerate-dependent phosphoglycerate mutase